MEKSKLDSLIDACGFTKQTTLEDIEVAYLCADSGSNIDRLFKGIPGDSPDKKAEHVFEYIKEKKF